MEKKRQYWWIASFSLILFLPLVVLAAVGVTELRRRAFEGSSGTALIGRVELWYNCNPASLWPGSTCSFSALAYDTNSTPMPESIIHYEWHISSSGSLGFLDRTEGPITNFRADKAGTGDLVVVATLRIPELQSQATKSVRIIVQGGSTPTPTPTSSIQPTPTMRPCSVCDFNGDGQICTDDLDLLSVCFGQQAIGECARFDMNGDGRINIIDLTRCGGCTTCLLGTPTPTPVNLCLSRDCHDYCDATGDGCFSGYDLPALSACYGQNPLTPECQKWDATGDGIVNILDFSCCSSHCSQCPTIQPSQCSCSGAEAWRRQMGDFNCDNTVDLLDVNLWFQKVRRESSSEDYDCSGGSNNDINTWVQHAI